jgi:hypothetical protein
MTTPTGMEVPARVSTAQGTHAGVDHGAGEAVLGGLVAEADDLGAGGLGLEQCVVEDCGERGG